MIRFIYLIICLLCIYKSNPADSFKVKKWSEIDLNASNSLDVIVAMYCLYLI